jgi:hypothetical protein
MTSLIVGITTGTVFVLTLWLLLAARKRRAAREHRAAQEAARIKEQNRLAERLMATSFEARRAVTFVALAMINAGPCHLMNDAMRSRVPWIEHFLANLVPVVNSVNNMSFDQIYTGPFKGKDSVLDTLANSPRFMHFVLRSCENIDTFLCAYWASLDEVYSRDIRDAARTEMVNAEDFMNYELKSIHKEFENLTSA